MMSILPQADEGLVVRIATHAGAHHVGAQIDDGRPSAWRVARRLQREVTRALEVGRLSDA